MFLEAYLEAHAERAAEVIGNASGVDRARALAIKVRVLRSAAAQRRMESFIARLASKVAAAMAEGDEDPTDADGRKAEELRIA